MSNKIFVILFYEFIVYQNLRLVTFSELRSQNHIAYVISGSNIFTHEEIGSNDGVSKI